MHSYLRSIGYSNIDNVQKTEELIRRATKNPTFVSVTDYSARYPMREYYYECAPGMGVCVLCEIDTDPTGESETPVRVLNHFPYSDCDSTSVSGDIYIDQKVDKKAFLGMCNDPRLGVALIFNMRNTVDYLNNRIKTDNGSITGDVRLSALSLSGKIILPVEKQKTAAETPILPYKKRAGMRDLSFENDDEQGLPFEEEFNLMGGDLLERAKTEDIFSIVDTTFMPHGAETDVYSIVGEIKDYRLVTNKDTNESVWMLTVLCKGVEMRVCINSADLLGVPEVRRRFRGIVWIQGEIRFK